MLPNIVKHSPPTLSRPWAHLAHVANVTSVASVTEKANVLFYLILINESLNRHVWLWKPYWALCV